MKKKHNKYNVNMILHLKKKKVSFDLLIWKYMKKEPSFFKINIIFIYFKII